LQHVPDPRLLVGFDQADDAGVFLLRPDLALVQTVDFFTPIVDDPYWFGAIAAANALSDVYAMGGVPVTALNVTCFPVDCLPLEVLGRILTGAREKCQEAGVTLLGGHTVDDPEPKFGMAVTGTVDPARMLTNAGAKEGDVLILTKAIGTGILTTALKRDRITEADVPELIPSMARLNADAGRLAVQHGAHGATDVTGYGLLGHLREMVLASGVGAQVLRSAVPILPLAEMLAKEGIVPGGTKRNLAFVEPLLKVASDLEEADLLLLADAQTSGGLLIACAEAQAEGLLSALTAAGCVAARIGAVGGSPGIRIVP
jgi:selenide,water dikinase